MVGGFLSYSTIGLNDMVTGRGEIDQAVKLLIEGKCPESAKTIFRNDPSPESKHALGLLLLKDESTRNEGITTLKDADLPKSHHALGMVYMKGLYGQQVNPKLAMEHLEVAANAGIVEAQVALGYLYWKGPGETNADIERVKMFINIGTVSKVRNVSVGLLSELKSFIAEQFPVEEVFKSMLIYGCNATVSHEFALKLSAYADANRLTGDPLAAVMNAISYLWANTRCDYPDSNYASKVEAPVATPLGCYIFSRWGTPESCFVEESLKVAADLWKKAAEAGNVKAKYFLGLVYCSGNGAKKDFSKGKKLLEEVQDQYAPAKLMLNYLTTKQSKKAQDSEILKSIAEAKKDEADFGDQPEKNCIAANKPFLNRAWSWLKKTSSWENIGIALFNTVIIVGLIASIVFLSIAYPWVMLGIFTAAAGATLVLGGIILCAFAAGGH